MRHLGRRGDDHADTVTIRDLDAYLQARLAIRHPNTAERERITLLQFYKWVTRQEYLTTSPAAGLAPIKGGEDPPPFRTTSEIERILARGGLSEEERLDLWDTLFLNPSEIAGLLATVRANASIDYAFLLHAIPAYTGMRGGSVEIEVGRRRPRRGLRFSPEQEAIPTQARDGTSDPDPPGVAKRAECLA